MQTSHLRQALLKRWNLVERINADSWVQWRTRYLQSMQARNKWQTPSRNFCVDDIVVVKDDTLVQLTWPLGRIVKLYPGSDNLVRTADIIRNGKEYNRAINQLVLLVSAESMTPPNQAISCHAQYIQVLITQPTANNLMSPSHLSLLHYTNPHPLSPIETPPHSQASFNYRLRLKGV